MITTEFKSMTKNLISNANIMYDIVSDHLESLSTSVPEILTAGRLKDQCSGLYD